MATEGLLSACASTEESGSDTEAEHLNHDVIRQALLKQTGTHYIVMPPARKDQILNVPIGYLTQRPICNLVVN